MKKLLTCLPLIVTLFVVGQTQAPYEIKSAKIDFVFNNGLQLGTKTLIFTDSGKIEKAVAATEIDTSFFKNMSKEFNENLGASKTMIIQTQDSVFTIDLKKLTGTKRQRINVGIPSFPDEQKKKTVTDSFLNRECEIVDFHSFKIWYWKGIAVKKEMVIDATHKIYEYATSIDEDYIIKAEDFEVPDNVKI